MNFFRRNRYNAICPYCLALMNMQPGAQITCGFCESELMRAMNFFVLLEDYLAEHTLADLEQMLLKAQAYQKTCHTKTAKFYAKDYIFSIKQVIKLQKKRLNRLAAKIQNDPR